MPYPLLGTIATSDLDLAHHDFSSEFIATKNTSGLQVSLSPLETLRFVLTNM
jgi:hypothetical protein